MNVTIVFKDGRAKDYNRVYDIHVYDEILWIHFYTLDGSVSHSGHKISNIKEIQRIDFV